MSDALHPPKRRSVAANAASLFAGRLISALSIWLALIVLAKLGDVTTVGTYALAQAICIPVGEIAKIGLREMRASDVQASFTAGDYLRLRIVLTVTAFIAMAAFGAWQSDTSTVLVVVLLYAVTRCFYMMTDILHAHFQQVERLDHTGWSLVMSGLLSLVALSLGFYLSGSLVVAVAGQIVAHGLVFFFYDLPISRRYAKAEKNVRVWRPAVLIQMVRIALPLGFATALLMIGLHLPRLWVGSVLGLAALGVFGPIVALAMAPDRLITAICQAAIVRLSLHYQAGRIDAMLFRLGQLVAVLLVLGIPAIFIAHAYGEELLTLIYSEAQAENSGLLVLLAIAALLRVSANILGFGLIASRKFWVTTVQHGLVAVVSIIACVTLIGPLGLTGAGYAMIAIFATQLTVVLVALALLRAGKLP